jgi:hypothetical protein
MTQEGTLRKQLGENIRQLIIPRDMTHTKTVELNLFTNKMIIQFNVFSTSMKTGFAVRYIAPTLSHHKSAG